MTKLAIITVHFHKPEDTQALLESLSKCKVAKDLQVTILVVDNGGGSCLRLDKYSNVKCLGNGVNLGFTGGNNLGISFAINNNFDYCLLLNNDTEVDSLFYQAISHSLAQNPNVGAIGALIYFAAGYEFHHHYQKNELGQVIWYAGGKFDKNNVLGSHAHVDEVDQGQFTKSFSTDFITGACLLVSTKVIKKVGLLDERYFMYLEDLEYSLRIQQAGFQLIVDPNIKLHHKVASSSGIGSNLNDYFITRNRLILGFTYSSFRTKFALLREAFRKILIGTPTSRLAVIDFVTGKLGKGSYIKT